jgi:hypothetical protein
MMAKHLLLTLAAAATLSACGGGNDRPKPVPAPIGGWEVGPIIGRTNYSSGFSAEITPEGYTLVVPTNGSLNYVVRPGSLIGKNRIVLRYRVVLDEGVKLLPKCCPQSMSIGPTLYFATSDNDWRKDGLRWWATFNAPTPIVAGEFELIAPLDGKWSSVIAMNAETHPLEFRNAINKANRIGFTFGGGDGFGHGIYATGRAKIIITYFGAE